MGFQVGQRSIAVSTPQTASGVAAISISPPPTDGSFACRSRSGRSVNVEGEHYRVKGAKPGPPPAHPIGIWVGAYGPRMLRLTGRLGDGWLSSLGPNYMSADDAPRMHAVVDEAARSAGRDPAEIERAVNVMALNGAPESWAHQIARIATELRFSTLLVRVPEENPVASYGGWARTRLRACASWSRDVETPALDA
jgi:hypothetical protein